MILITSRAKTKTVQLNGLPPLQPKSPSKHRIYRAGFTLVEVMVTVLIIAVLGGVAMTNFGTSNEAAKKIVAQADANMLNKAIQTYLSNGGSLDGVTNPLNVIAKLKTKPLASQATQIAGANGPFVDLRLELTAAEPTVPASLVYDPAKKAFTSVAGSAGLVVGMNEELAKNAVATEDRTVRLALATKDKWVWDFANQAAPDRAAPNRPVDHKNLNSLPAGTPNLVAATPLSTPTLSLPGGTLGPLDYPKTVTIFNGNSPGVGQVFIRINGGDWNPYTGAITLPPGDTIKVDTYAGTLSPDEFSASPTTSVTYTFQPGQLTAPEITPASGLFKYGLFPTQMTLRNTNSTGVSTMEYKVGNSAWMPYSAAVTLTADVSVPVSARAVPVNPKLWLTSGTYNALYQIDPQKLQAPVIAKASGTYTFDTFPSTLSLTDPNIPGASRLEYQIGTGAWTTYTTPVPLTLDLSVSAAARAVPLDTRFWLTSDTASALYQYNAQKLLTPVIATASGTFTYSAFPTTLSVQNPNRAGVSTLEYKIGTGNWTPYTAAVPLTLDLSVTVSARAVPVNPRLWVTSDTASALYQYVPQKLQTPVITQASGKYLFNVFPTPLPIQDPNIAGTSKVEYKIGTGAWTSYTSPVVLTPDLSVSVSARAVPVDTRLWLTSDTASAIYELLQENLLVPVFSKAAGSYPAMNYPLTVALTNPNVTGSSTLEYRQLNGTWQSYITPITIAATQVDLTLEARAVTTDAKRWVTSATAQSRYLLTQSQLYPPVITPPSGYYPYSGFPTVATIANPNPAGSSDIYYRVGTTGSFVKYNPLTPPALSKDNYTTTIQTYAKSLMTVQFSDSTQAQAIYESIYFISASSGVFHDPSSATPSKLVTNMAAPKTGTLFKWGGTSGSGQTQSWMQFDGTPASKVAPGDWFVLGKLTYYNGTITTGTGADNVKLKFTLNITQPTIVTTNADFTLSLINTPNTSDPLASADYVYIPALSVPFTTTVAGRNYKLDVRFGETTADGFTTVTEFHVLEEKTATGTLYGKMTEILP